MLTSLRISTKNSLFVLPGGEGRLMKLETLKYAHARWAPDKFPALDSDNTLVVAFGAPSFRDNPAPIAELGRAFPNSVVIGCSTAGEIFGDTVMDESLSVGV